MRVGFITQLLWPRYGDFWTQLIAGAGLEVVYPPDDEVKRRLNTPQLDAVPGLAFRLAAAQALSLGTDAIIAPELNPGAISARGGAQDAFIADFPQALRSSMYGLPPIIGVPASLEGEGLEGLVIRTLLNLTHDPALVRRTWERWRTLAKPPRYPEPKWRVRPSGGGTVGVLGQPWLLNDALARRLAAEGHTSQDTAQNIGQNTAQAGSAQNGPHHVSQHQLAPALLREEGQRIDDRLLGTDTEVLGAARFLGRKGSVERLVMIADETSSADAYLVGRVRKIVYKPFSVVSLQALSTAPPAALNPLGASPSGEEER